METDIYEKQDHAECVTEDDVKQWRGVLEVIMGRLALVMPADQVRWYAERMRERMVA